jgi:hypothetical protein
MRRERRRDREEEGGGERRLFSTPTLVTSTAGMEDINARSKANTAISNCGNWRFARGGLFGGGIMPSANESPFPTDLSWITAFLRSVLSGQRPLRSSHRNQKSALA